VFGQKKGKSLPQEKGLKGEAFGCGELKGNEDIGHMKLEMTSLSDCRY